MTTSNGVPPWARRVLEELRSFAGEMRRYGDDVEVIGFAAGKLEDVLTAALAASGPDAGTPVEGMTGKPGPCPECGAIRNERDAHFCSATALAAKRASDAGTGERKPGWYECAKCDYTYPHPPEGPSCPRCGGTGKWSDDFTGPAPVSGAAPEEREKGLDRLLTELDTAVRRFVATRDEPSAQARLSELDAAHERIRDFVAQRERAAREAGRAELHALAERWFDNARDARERGWHNVGLKYQECATQLRATLASDAPRRGKEEAPDAHP